VGVRTFFVALLIAGCSTNAPPTRGHIVVAVTIDWEGVLLEPEAFAAVEQLRAQLREVPLTHFVSAAYFTKLHPDPTLRAALVKAVHSGDELAVHLHAWRSLAAAAGITPKTSPSFFSGTDALLDVDDNDVGFDTDPDVYSVPELRELLRTSRRLLEQTGIPVSKSFRAGGYLGTPKVLQAIADEGYLVDSSAIEFRKLDTGDPDDVLRERVAQIWPRIDRTTQPYTIAVTGHELLELPIAAVADYATALDVVHAFEMAHARLITAPSRDVFVVLGFHLETATDFVARISEAMAKVQANAELVRDVEFVTIERAATRARAGLSAR